MSIKMDVVISSPANTLDMKSGLDTLQGVSDVARCITETVVTGEVPQRKSHQSKVRTIMMRNFQGSYGQIFSVDMFDDAALQRYNEIGKGTIVELISYFLNESVNIERVNPLTENAQRVVDRLGDNSEKLIQQLRKSPLKRLHEVAVKFGYSVKIRYRKNRDDQTELATFDQNTARLLFAKLARRDVRVSLAVTRLNINTGNGRALVGDSEVILAFGFSIMYARVPPALKRTFSENLNFNNTHGSNAWAFLDVVARPLQLADGTVVKYIIKELAV